MSLISPFNKVFGIASPFTPSPIGGIFTRAFVAAFV